MKKKPETIPGVSPIYKQLFDIQKKQAGLMEAFKVLEAQKAKVLEEINKLEGKK